MEAQPWLVGIEGEHVLRLIESDAPIIAVISGPGSGKTTAIERRVQRLVGDAGVDPERIFVGTFTRAITRDLQEAIGEELRVSTLHSLARRLLRENPAALGGRRLRFLLHFEEDAMLYDIGQEMPEAGDLPARRRLLKQTESSRSERTALPNARFAGLVDTWLRTHGGMLIGDVVPIALDGLISGDIAAPFDHVLIDEYQDLTAAEQELVERIWTREGSLVVLGDNDQSIYRFRFNHPEGITAFAERWRQQGEEVLEIVLPENRRCGTSIVELANIMMAEAGSTKAPMVACRLEVGEATQVHWDSLEAEIAGLAEYIRGEPGQFLVLVPRRFIGYRLADQIGPDARTSFHQEGLESPVVQERFTLGRLLADTEDRVALRAWLGFRGDRPEPAGDRNAAAYASIYQARDSANALVDAVNTGEIAVTGAGRGNVVRRMERLAEARREAPAGLRDLIAYLFDPAFANVIDDEEKRRWAARDLEELRDCALDLSDREGATLSSVLEAMTYRIATRAPLSEQDAEPRVSIMTLHSAKGLEGDSIVLVGLADQVVPGFAQGEDRAEQRRLLYVAVTRARDRLVLSWPRSIAYADASHNRIRLDQVRTIEGESRVIVSRSNLLPAGLPDPLSGIAWRAQQLGN
jgi:superfamily I DNA/RNA helicase